MARLDNGNKTTLSLLSDQLARLVAMCELERLVAMCELERLVAMYTHFNKPFLLA